jgi:hypothetical protein
MLMIFTVVDLSKALCEVKFPKFATSILMQDTRLDQSGIVEDQASAARHWTSGFQEPWFGSAPRVQMV